MNIYIGEAEWNEFSFENKMKLLYRLRQSQSELARQMEPCISLMVEEERNRQEIDIEATLKHCLEEE
ncbi:hypothetical protein IRB79_27335 (plasmid) [Cytobacillus oceanisediminis]|nr:hypothetical protein IRB79_27335 [Cytobacillus oceanisediminis]